MSACTRTGGQGSGRKGGGRGQTATVAAAAAAATDWIELRSAGSESSGNGSSPGSASPYSRYHFSHVKQVKPGFTNYLLRGLAQKIESF